MFEYNVEKELQDHIADNFNKFFHFKFVAKEFMLDNHCEVDLVGEDNRSIYLIELKRDYVTHYAVRQITEYVEYYQTKTDKNVLGIIAAPKVKKDAYKALKDDGKVDILRLENVRCLTDTSPSTALKNKTRFSATLSNNLLEGLKLLSSESDVPQSKLFDEAISILLEKYSNTVRYHRKLSDYSSFISK